jgi:23S rRNA (adenine2503-C2)-methyltransferase
MSTRYASDREDFATWLAAHGAPRYRVDQVWDALYRQRVALEDATALPRALRSELTDAFPLALAEVARATGDHDTTVKWLWRAAGAVDIETVLMRSPSRATVCVSSQAGCAMACTFCATGQAGFERHLDVGEIVEQVARAAIASPQPVTNVVFMGMGEPLANFDPTWAAVERLHGDFAISARRITVSTVGIVPGIRRLAAADLPVTLAVSLHAPDDALRDTLVPVNRRYPLAEVLDAASDFAARRGRRVTFEYAVIAGVNDAPEQAVALAALLRPLGALGAHVNLIPLNPTTDFTGAAPPRARVQAFAATLRGAGVNATVRRNRGTDIDAACGQLRRRVAPVAHPGAAAARMGG